MVSCYFAICLMLTLVTIDAATLSEVQARRSFYTNEKGGGVIPSCIGFQIYTFVRDVLESCGTCASRSSEKENKCSSPKCCGGYLGHNQYVICKTSGCCLRMMGAKAGGRIFAPISSSVIDLTKVGSCVNNALLASKPHILCPYQCAVASTTSGANSVECPYGVSLPGIDDTFTPSNSSFGSCYKPSSQRDSSPQKSQSHDHAHALAIEKNDALAVAKNERKSASCFPGNASVELRNGISIRMDDLQLGDDVKVGLNEYSTVFMFTHRDGKIQSNFVTLRTESDEVISISPEHYIYADDSLVAASEVSLGSVLLLGDGRRSRVTYITSSKGSGLYNPQTLNGNIVVNGVLASTYTTAVDAATAHGLLAPLRWLYSTLKLSATWLERGAKGQLILFALESLPVGALVDAGL